MKTAEGKERECEGGEEKRGTKENIQRRKKRVWPSCVKKMKRDNMVCVVLGPPNGRNLNGAQTPLQTQSWGCPVGEKFLMIRDSGAAQTLRER